MFDIIALDADDTLWRNEELYHEARAQFGDLLAMHGQRDDALRKLDRTEVDNIECYGYGIKSFILSMIETAIEATDGAIEGRTVRKIIDVARGMLVAPVEVFEHTEETLVTLSEKHDLMLITKGDQFEQERKVRRSGLGKYFRYVEVVSEKSRDTYLTLLNKYGIDPKRFLMVGNSLRSDISPVVGIGGRAVHIPYPSTWFHEMLVDETLDDSQYDELEHLGQLPEYLDRLCGDE